MGTSEITRFPRLYYSQGGFTLVETMTTLAVASILLTATVPPMQDFVIRNRMSTEVNTFLASLYLARSEAVKRLQDVSLCPTTTGISCDNSNNWDQGWMVYADVDNDNTYSSGDVVIQQNPRLPDRFKNTGQTGPNANITFNSRGSSNSGSFSFTDTGGVADPRCLTVSSAGRSYVNSGVCS
jgi:type IV fimbrial biogenesis protein FimT